MLTAPISIPIFLLAYIAVALATYIILCYTDPFGLVHCSGYLSPALLWPVFLVCVVMAAAIWAVVHIINSFINSF